MKPFTITSLFLFSVLLCNTSASVHAETSQWSKHNSAGEAAYKRGDLIQAESAFRSALTEAQKPGEEGAHLAFSLHRLAELYKAQGRKEAAEALLRSYTIVQQKTLAREQKKALKHAASLPQVNSASTSTQQPNQQAPVDKGPTQLGRGGWDGNDLRINRKFDY